MSTSLQTILPADVCIAGCQLLLEEQKMNAEKSLICQAETCRSAVSKRERQN
jgi:hypothetical protein